jgi:hypothetical protein
LRSPNFFLLLAKEWRELIASRAFWFLLLVIGPLVGYSFITAVRLYAEASGIGGGPAALAEGLTPLDGMLAPTLGAYDLAATFLFPFVAIRLISAEKQNGGLPLLLQLPGSLVSKIAAKGTVLLAGWLVALIPGLVALLLWKTYGGHLYAPETLNLLFGHLLRMMLSGGIAVAAAAIAESAASAAIVTLTFTIGAWALDFVAAYRGGFLQELGAYTPTAALRSFEQGLLRINTVIVMIAFTLAGFMLAVIWLHTGTTLKRRILTTAPVILFVALVVLGAGHLRKSWDLSENRRNSFSRADELALGTIQSPLRISVYLAPEDPRLTDFEQNVVKKLRRVLPHLDVDYKAGGRTGLFESDAEHYGEIWYEMNGKKVMERSTIEQVVLEQVYGLSGSATPARNEEDSFPGYPLAVNPKWPAGVFYGLWPLFTVLGWWLLRR